MRVHLVNEGKKSVRLKAVNLVMTINGQKTPSAPLPLVRDVAPTQRALVAELPERVGGGRDVVEPRGGGDFRPRRDRDQPPELELTPSGC